MSGFNGFSNESIHFISNLRHNNSKAWFTENRHIYDKYLFPEAQTFVVEMGSLLSKQLAPQINAIPKTDKSIFRLHRDVRFSKDKSPYKTHLGIFLWEGEGKKLDCSGFYLQLNHDSILIGVGMYLFPKNILALYREAVVHPAHGPALKKIIQKVTEEEKFVHNEKHYKKTPRGFDPAHPNSDLLLYNGMAFMYESAHPEELAGPEFLDYCYNKFEQMAPLHNWLREAIKTD